MPKPITEDDVIELLKPLTINDILISTKPYYLEINYFYNNINFTYTQTSPHLKGTLQACIRAISDKETACLDIGHSILYVSSNSTDTFDIKLMQDSACSLENIKNITEQLEESIYEKLNSFNLLAY